MLRDKRTILLIFLYIIMIINRTLNYVKLMFDIRHLKSGGELQQTISFRFFFLLQRFEQKPDNYFKKV